jgi:hypothetical protein
VAHGAFEMLGGEVTGNDATRQGGGVFVHWGEARFTASGSSAITGNDGVGSSKAICNRGLTEMMGSALADKVYVWDYGETPYQSFTLAENAQVTGIVLAYSDMNKNFITIANSYETASIICTIDLESRLINGLLKAHIDDWIGKTVITGAENTLKTLITGNTSSGADSIAGKTRLPLNTFVGAETINNLERIYMISITSTAGKFEVRP